MITTLGFDTIIIQANTFYSEPNQINQAFETFYKFGIKNFLFVFDYNPLCDSITILKSKATAFKNMASNNCSHRINIKIAYNLIVSPGVAFNNSINRLLVSKNSKALFVSLPLFTDTNYDPIALDINHLLYKKSYFLIFNSFEKIVESSNIEFCSKFINNPRIGICVDLNYLLNPNKEKFFKQLLNSNCLILPSVSNELGNYVGALSAADFIIDKYNKKSYYNICSLINKASSKIFT